jgi:hypothetical protein
MTDQERKELLRYMKNAVEKMDTDRDYSRQMLVEIGLYSPKGALTEPYKHLAPLRESGVLRSF